MREKMKATNRLPIPVTAAADSVSAVIVQKECKVKVSPAHLELELASSWRSIFSAFVQFTAAASGTRRSLGLCENLIGQCSAVVVVVVHSSRTFGG